MDDGRKMRKLGGRAAAAARQKFSRIGNSLLTNGGAIPKNYD